MSDYSDLPQELKNQINSFRAKKEKDAKYKRQRVKIFDHYDSGGLENSINEWLKKEGDNIKILDIKYQGFVNETDDINESGYEYSFSALIHYLY